MCFIINVYTGLRLPLALMGATTLAARGLIAPLMQMTRETSCHANSLSFRALCRFRSEYYAVAQLAL